MADLPLNIYTLVQPGYCPGVRVIFTVFGGLFLLASEVLKFRRRVCVSACVGRASLRLPVLVNFEWIYELIWCFWRYMCLFLR